MKALLCVAHGSKREASNVEFQTMVSQLKVTLADSFSSIEAAYLEFAAPDMQDALKSMLTSGVTHICIYPFFLNSGKHVVHDIPTIIQTIQNDYPNVIFETLPHFGSSSHILSVITNDLKGL
jgi:sirohydrochlorin cobaltochelatase